MRVHPRYPWSCISRRCQGQQIEEIVKHYIYIYIHTIYMYIYTYIHIYACVVYFSQVPGPAD